MLRFTGGVIFLKKDTSEILKELEGFSDFKSFYEENGEQLAEVALCDYLEALLLKKGLNKAEVITKSELSEVYAYQIFSGIKKSPSRGKLLCFGMELSLDETQEMLKKTGFAPLYAKTPFDCVVIYGLCKGMSVVGVNELLYEYGQELLG